MVFIASRPPYHRQNRRRSRPGARTRKALSMRESIEHDFDEGISVARDSTLWLPAEKQPPCFNCWQMGVYSELPEDERACFFGGDVDDDDRVDDIESWMNSSLTHVLREQELHRMGILYEADKDAPLSESDSTIRPEAPQEFYIRPARSKRQSQTSRNAQFLLPEYLTASLLSDNPSIAPWLLSQTAASAKPGTTPSYPSRITIQHRPNYTYNPTPQSLPPSLANSEIPDISRVASTSLLLFPLEHDDEDLSDATWDFITSSTRSSAPPSEPETWILLE